MIIPAGKRKNQVSQGLSKNETIFNNDVFASIKVAIAPPIEDDLAASESAEVSPDLQNTMNQTNDSRMQMSDDSGKQSNTGQDFSIIADQLTRFISQSDKLSQTYTLTSQQMSQKDGRVTFVIEPLQTPNLGGPQVTKDGPAFTGMQQQDRVTRV